MPCSYNPARLCTAQAKTYRTPVAQVLTLEPTNGYHAAELNLEAPFR